MAKKLQCDLVMRGGITSGIVYPGAIAKLAETYDFRNIGGTSAGAIAAAGAAAAAYGARKGKDHFQTLIADLPKRLGTKKKGKTELERLFQPQRSTRRLFRVLLSGLGHKTTVGTILSVLLALLRAYWRAALLVAVLVLGALLAFGLYNALGPALWGLLAMGLVPALVFAILAALGCALCDVLKRLPENGYGMCAGSGGKDDAEVLPLTDWLHDYFQTLAGLPPNQPVTVRDLWDPHDKVNERDIEIAERDIDLVLMTTNITRGISQRFPFLEGSWGRLFFKKEEFERLFPKAVVNHLCAKGAHRRKIEDQKDWERYEAKVNTEGYVPLPMPADLPVLLGARMSLSFPFLLSAVPLYAANIADKDETGKSPLRRCWFSDGGLTSNFPLHFFDSPLPSRPTFGINLVPATVELAETDDEVTQISRLPEAGDDPWSHIYMPRDNASGIGSAARFNEFEGKEGEAPSIGGFSGALLDTARNWADTELMALPGYRDRIVHVSLSENEGGMNLNMEGSDIKKIAKRGEKAGELLTARFATEPGKDPRSNEDIVLTWDNHRWIRYRTMMAGLELAIRRLRNTWNSGYWELINRHKDDAPGYKFANLPQQAFARKATKQVLVAAGLWQRVSGQTFDRYDDKTSGRSPRPKPALRMMPPGSNDPRAERPDQS